MKLSDVINAEWLDASALNAQYRSATPFPHIVMRNFVRAEVLDEVLNEFPDLATTPNSTIKFQDDRQIKLASSGMAPLSRAALHLNTYLQSDLFMGWLNTLTGIEEPLISDPYLAGGGYHEIKSGGLLKVHADFNKHPRLDLDRRLNLLVYLNKDWSEGWGGALQLFDQEMNAAEQTIFPHFNTAVIFTTTSYTYHGHPDPLRCPEGMSRKSLAYYYFSTGRPEHEISQDKHSTLFKERNGERFDRQSHLKTLVKRVTPPILIDIAKAITR